MIRTPSLAPTPVPTMTAVGVASPSAQGHATTSTATPNRSPNSAGPSRSYQLRGIARVAASAVHTITATHATTTTPSTK